MIFSLILGLLGSAKTVAASKASVDGDGKQGSLRGSKRLSVKGNIAAPQSEQPGQAPDDEQPEVCRFFA
jgi:hypothetical protein